MVKVGNFVILRNFVRDEWKGGWSKAQYNGPYSIYKIQRNNNFVLQNMQGKLLIKNPFNFKLKILYCQKLEKSY